MCVYIYIYIYTYTCVYINIYIHIETDFEVYCSLQRLSNQIWVVDAQREPTQTIFRANTSSSSQHILYSKSKVWRQARHIYIYIYIHIYVILIFVYVCACVCMCVYVCMYVYMYACIHIYIYIYIYICIIHCTCDTTEALEEILGVRVQRRHVGRLGRNNNNVYDSYEC